MTLELLAKTHRRKAKLLSIRVKDHNQSSSDILKSKIKMLKREKQVESGKPGGFLSRQATGLNE